jgi:hypothetical protein
LKNWASRWSGIRFGFCVPFLVSAILTLISHAASSTGTLTVSPSNINFGSVPVGSSATQSLTLANPGWQRLTITQATLSGTGFTLSGLSYPLTLSGRQSVTCTVTFAPQAGGSNSGSVSIAFSTGTGGKWHENSSSSTSSSSTTLTVSMSGTGMTSGQLASNPVSLNFGSVQVGNGQTISETVSNSGGVAVNISQASVSGAGFSVSGLTPPLSLTPGQSITFNATFSPQSAGSASGNITLGSNASNPTLTISLAGNGTAAGQLSVSPTSFNFGNVVVGASASTSASLGASTASVTVTSITLSNSEFAVSGISFPLTIPAGQSVPFTATFAPQASGTTSASASFASNAANSPTVVSLGGAGTPPPQYSVGLSWTASTSQNVSGYNIYRSTASGGPYTQINSALNPATSYTDGSVTAGQTYYYVTTAVNSSDQESSYSNQVTAVIP